MVFKVWKVFPLPEMDPCGDTRALVEVASVSDPLLPVDPVDVLEREERLELTERTLAASSNRFAKDPRFRGCLASNVGFVGGAILETDDFLVSTESAHVRQCGS